MRDIERHLAGLRAAFGSFRAAPDIGQLGAHAVHDLAGRLLDERLVVQLPSRALNALFEMRDFFSRRARFMAALGSSGDVDLQIEIRGGAERPDSGYGATLLNVELAELT